MPLIPQFTDESLDTFLRRTVRHYHATFPARKPATPPQPSPDDLHLLRTILGMYVEEIGCQCAWDEAETQAVAFVAGLIGEIRKVEEQAEREYREEKGTVLFRLRQAANGCIQPPRHIRNAYLTTARQRATLGAKIRGKSP